MLAPPVLAGSRGEPPPSAEAWCDLLSFSNVAAMLIAVAPGAAGFSFTFWGQAPPTIGVTFSLTINNFKLRLGCP